MKALVFHGVGDIRVDDVPEPRLEAGSDALIEISAAAVSNWERQLADGILPGLRPGTILGREAVGIVTEVGTDVRNLHPGDRVVVASTIGCGTCRYCLEGCYAQCDGANPNGAHSGPVFLGGTRASGSLDGVLAERARIPFASVNLVKLPDEIPDPEALLLSDVLPTGYFTAELAEVAAGDVVAIFGCGLVGQASIQAAIAAGAGRVFAIDNVPSRIDAAQAMGAEVINFDETQPVDTILALTRGVGPNRVIDAVGVAAHRPFHRDSTTLQDDELARIERQRSQVTPVAWSEPQSSDDATQVLKWAVSVAAKGGTLAVVGVYPPSFEWFPLGKAFAKNLTIKTGTCSHRKYIPKLMSGIASGQIDASRLAGGLTCCSTPAEALKCLESIDSAAAPQEMLA